MASFVLAACAALLVASEPVAWTGGGSNNLWDNPANWNPLKIPQPFDDITIPSNSDVLIGTASGARVNSINVASGTKFVILGCSVTVGPGGITFAGTSTFLIDTGAGTLSSGGTINIKDSVAVTWHSGHIDGTWVYSPQASLLINQANYLLCTGGDITISQLTITGGALLNSTCPVHSSGTISVTSTSPSQPTTILQLIVDGASKLAITGSNAVAALNLVHPAPVTISAPLNWRPLANAELWGVSLSSTSTLIEPSNVTIHNLTGTGTFGLTGAAAVLTVSDSAQLTALNLNNGKLNCINGSVQIATIVANDGAVVLPNKCTLQVADSIQTAGNVFLSGLGAVTTPSASFAGQITIDGSVDVTQQAKIGASMTLNGLFTVEKSASLTFQCLPTCDKQNVWSPADSRRPGTLRLNGDFSIAGASNPVHLIINSLLFQGTGNVNLGSAQSTLDLQNVNVTIPTVTLNTNTSILMGETLALAYNTLVGPAPGQKIGISQDSSYSECVSPCGASPMPFFPYQQFQAIPRS